MLRSAVLGCWREVWYRSSSLKPRVRSNGCAAASSDSRVSVSSHLTPAVAENRSEAVRNAYEKQLLAREESPCVNRL